jgi:membrane-associated phospholipid phosphatase
MNAALDPRTLAPAGAAAVLSIGDLDERLTREAADATPVFGSRKAAQIYSDAMEAALIAEAIGTALAAPSGPIDDEWWIAKLKGGLGVEGGALGVTAGLTYLLKEGVGRARPDGSADDSFPSGHAANSSAAAVLSSSNLAAQRLDPRVHTIVEVTNTVAAASVAWARVEAGEHFAADVFAGAALGNFVGMFVHDAFLGLSKEDAGYWRIVPVRGGAMLIIGWTF